MKIFKLVLILLMFGTVAAQAKTLSINQQRFEIKTTHGETDEGFEQDNLELYRGDKKLLTHTQRLSTGDCSILTIEVGDYDIKGNQLIFYTYWAASDRQGLWAYPYGVRKQIYTVNDKGGVDLTSAVIYVEDYNSEGDPQEIDAEKEYLQFLHTAPKNQQQRQALNHYMQSMQTRYKARFVSGKERTQLIQEVERRLAPQIKTETQSWQADLKDYTQNKNTALRYLRMGQQL
ncbi:hypothetical protein [Acinetobacter wuhouensis]|uniref:hypothetical protein n=1 Tax=Acinetobacter wuhouensis TaxID=1879050 RepID=UPI001D17E05E|nr:hypothetical protein [Acinetobacter wuhouensis]